MRIGKDYDETKRIAKSTTRQNKTIARQDETRQDTIFDSTRLHHTKSPRKVARVDDYTTLSPYLP